MLRAGTIRIATYNVENYLDQPTESRRYAKSDAARAKIRESIHALNPDVIALEEMGRLSALMELRDSLKREQLEYPYWELVNGWDTNIHVAVLSRLPIVASRPHTNDLYLLDGRRFFVSRGFAEVDLRAGSGFGFTLIAGHLKSRRQVQDADESEERLQEAKQLRALIDGRLKSDPGANLVVLGDFNDVKDSDPVKTILGRGRSRLVDTRPSERNGDDGAAPQPYYDPRSVAWTHYYGKEDTYSRVDYILLSPAMAKHWLKSGTYVLTQPNWGVGSDHRPIVAAFETEPR